MKPVTLEVALNNMISGVFINTSRRMFALTISFKICKKTNIFRTKNSDNARSESSRFLNVKLALTWYLYLLLKRVNLTEGILLERFHLKCKNYKTTRPVSTKVYTKSTSKKQNKQVNVNVWCVNLKGTKIWRNSRMRIFFRKGTENNFNTSIASVCYLR